MITIFIADSNFVLRIEWREVGRNSRVLRELLKNMRLASREGQTIKISTWGKI